MASIRKAKASAWAGKEIFEVHPVILGGDPVDPKNKVVLDREEHIRAVNYWNGVIKKLRVESGKK